jgi:hypothetical protein
MARAFILESPAQNIGSGKNIPPAKSDYFSEPIFFFEFTGGL